MQKSNERVLIFILFCIQFTHVLDFVIMMPLGPQLMRVFEITAQQFSIVVSSYTFSAAIAGLISATFIDQFDRKRALLVAYTGFVFGTVLCGIAPSFELLLGARIIAGGFGGVVGAMTFSIIGEAIPMERRGKVTGIVMSAFSVSSIIGIPLGLYLATKFSWHVPFFIISAVGVVVILIGNLMLPSMKQHLSLNTKHNVVEDLKIIITHPNHRWSFLFTVLLMAGAFTIIPFISPYMVKNVGLREDQLPLIYLSGGLFTFVTSQTFGRLSDKYGKHRIFFILATLSIVPIYALTNLPSYPLPAVLMVTTFFMICMSGRFVPAMALITSSAMPEHRGGFMSINGSIQQAGAGLAALISGMVITTSASGQLEHFNWVGFIAILATLMSLVVSKKIKSA